MTNRARRQTLREIAARLRALAQKDYTNSYGDYYAEGRMLNDDADRLEWLADGLTDSPTAN